MQANSSFQPIDYKYVSLHGLTPFGILRVQRHVACQCGAKTM